MKLSITFLLLLLSFLSVANQGLSETSVSETGKTEFLRIKKDNNNVPVALQLANARYVPISGIPKGMHVDLISALHIADQSYYDNLNKLFKQYDVVLYELVAEENTRVTERQGNSGKGILSALQHGMKNILGLTFQLDEVDYSPSNFVHADISPDDFINSMDEKGESFLSMFLNMWLIGIQQQATNPNSVSDFELITALLSPHREKDLKIIAAKQFLELEPALNALEGENGSTIITARNLKALKVLRREIEKGHKTFAIFYGAGHMPEMSKVLMKEFKLKPDQINWVDAWDLR